MRLIAILAIFLFSATAALADDWTVTKQRGRVLELVAGEWQPVRRGDVIPDDRVIRTLEARVTLVRGQEMIELGPDTQIQIFDEPSRRPFTTVKQYFGTLEVEAEVRNVEHFAVQTPLLVAVVKGTRFSVTSGDGDSFVTVLRGQVGVLNRDSRARVNISAGQSAGRRAGSQIAVVGESGPLVGPNGEALTEKELKAYEKALKAEAKAAEKALKDAAKDAAKEAKDAAKDVKKATKDTAKAAKKALKGLL